MNITKETIKKLSENWKNPMSGGLSDDSNPSDFDIDQLIKGVKIELEHTKDLKIALKISMDHLQEFPKYYDYLIDMENKIKKELKENVTMRSIREYLEENLNEGTLYGDLKFDRKLDSDLKEGDWVWRKRTGSFHKVIKDKDKLSFGKASVMGPANDKDIKKTIKQR